MDKSLKGTLFACWDENTLLLDEILELKEKYPVQLCGCDIHGMSRKAVMKLIHDFNERNAKPPHYPYSEES